MSEEQAGELCGLPVPELEPTFENPCLLSDEETGEPVVAVFEAPDLDAFESHVLGIKWADKTEQHVTFGFRGKRVMMKSEGCEATAFTRDNPETAAYLAAYSVRLAEIMGELLPETG
jgi:hypothetical protein